MPLETDERTHRTIDTVEREVEMSKGMKLGEAFFAPIKGIVFCACGKTAGVITSDAAKSAEMCIPCARRWVKQIEACYPNEKWAEVDS